MMPKLDRNPLTRWLAAERATRDDEAEAALAALFAALPQPVLPVGFADRVLARVGLPPAATAWGLDRLAAGLFVALATALGSLALLPASWLAALAAGAAGTLAGLGLGLARGVSLLLPLWRGLAEVAHWASLAVADPQGAALLGLCTLLSAMAARLLYGLLDERSPRYAD
ncbi:MAG TPA: hypothetical protein VMT16_02700 [Thermoanaerobaculia bacterium]|nr:hypothetical protein [Thermoanaerobaculia bacterium]